MAEQAYGVRGAGRVLHLMKGDVSTWCGSPATVVDEYPSARMCRACQHNKIANDERVNARSRRWR